MNSFPCLLADNTNTTSTVVLQNSEPDETNEDGASRKGRKRKLQKNQWKRNVAKAKRNKGEAYIDAKGMQITARSMKIGCEGKCRYQCNKIEDHKRSQIFGKYWGIGDVNRQRQYVASCMSKSQPQYRRVKEGTARNVNYEYHFEVDGLKYRVCKKFFMDTLNVGDKMIRNTMKKTCDGVVAEDMRGKHSNHPTIDPAVSEDIKTHIKSIPRIESHYLRKQTSREFISGGKTLADLHRDYEKECREQGRSHGTYAAYRNIFLRDFNISFFVPKKDQCAFCEKVKNSDAKEVLANVYESHRKEIELSRTEKAKDSDLAKQGKCVTACFDLQAVLPTPCGDVSAFYYKRRLSVLNFTIYDMGRNAGYCYVWHEGAGRRGPNEIASCLLQFLQQNCDKDDVCFYSDNCAGQNKNKFIVALYLYAVSISDIASITHKFLVTGHTQNEGDHLHSLIEKQKKLVLKSGPISVPAQWITVIQMAKKRGNPLKVTEMDTQDFMDFKTLSKFYGTNFSVNTEKEKIMWQSIREIKVEKEKTFQFSYKTCFEGTSKTVLTRKVTRGRPSVPTLSRVYTSPPGITEAKKRTCYLFVKMEF